MVRCTDPYKKQLLSERQLFRIPEGSLRLFQFVENAVLVACEQLEDNRARDRDGFPPRACAWKEVVGEFTVRWVREKNHDGMGTEYRQASIESDVIVAGGGAKSKIIVEIKKGGNSGPKLGVRAHWLGTKACDTWEDETGLYGSWDRSLLMNVLGEVDSFRKELLPRN